MCYCLKPDPLIEMFFLAQSHVCFFGITAQLIVSEGVRVCACSLCRQSVLCVCAGRSAAAAAVSGDHSSVTAGSFAA